MTLYKYKITSKTPYNINEIKEQDYGNYLCDLKHYGSDKPNDYYQGKKVELLEILERPILEYLKYEYPVWTSIQDGKITIDSDYSRIYLNKDDLTELIGELVTIRDSLGDEGG